MRRSVVFVALAAVLPTPLYRLLLAVYPNRRVCHLFEFFTDGWAPEYPANCAQLGLYRAWERSFARGAFDPRGDIAAAVVELASEGGSLLEIAAGDGGISTMLLGSARERGLKGANATLILTDINPHISSWKRLQQKYPGGFVDFIPSSVDATDLAGSLARVGADAPAAAKSAQVRMINIALHHFKPALVRSVFADVVATQGAFIVGDLKPSAGALFNNYLLIPPVMPRVLLEIFPMPLQWVLSLPMWPILAIWDASISILRSYSVEELVQLAESVPGGGSDKYAWRVIESGSFADFLGVPVWLRPLLPGSDEAVVQFFFYYPKALHKRSGVPPPRSR